ncbi:MAG: hypothetical protein ACOC54_01735 [Candidatus Sumerlaeota bacterium]
MGIDAPAEIGPFFRNPAFLYFRFIPDCNIYYSCLLSVGAYGRKGLAGWLFARIRVRFSPKISSEKNIRKKCCTRWPKEGYSGLREQIFAVQARYPMLLSAIKLFCYGLAYLVVGRVLLLQDVVFLTPENGSE